MRFPGLLCLVALLSGCGGGSNGGGGGDGAAGTGGPMTGGGGAGGFAGAGTLGGFGGPGTAGGFAGSAGIAGMIVAGGRGGTGANNACLLSPPPTNCGASMCGNGKRDTCVIRAAFDDCAEERFTEVCDGADLGGASCESFGYGSGTLACSNVCQTLDMRGCNECRRLDTKLLACGSAPLAIAPLMVSVAATDTEIALAWLESDANDEIVLGFARLTPDLALLTSTRVQDSGVTGFALASDLLLAPLPSGWVVAGASLPDVFVHAFDAAGRHVARTTVTTLADNDLFAPPVIASRPDGGPLLAWMTASAVRATMVAADGRSASAPFDVDTADVFGGRLSATFVGNAFYVANVIERPANPQQLRIRRVETDGRISAAFDALPGVNVFDPMLLAGANDLRVLYGGFVNSVPGADPVWSVLLQRVGSTGAAVAAPVAVSKTPEDVNVALAVGLGSDSAVMLVSLSSPRSIQLERIASDGTLVSPAHAIASGGTFEGGWNHQLVRRGPDAVVMWVAEADVVRLARVVP